MKNNEEKIQELIQEAATREVDAEGFRKRLEKWRKLKNHE
jgi:hypothetical protein